MTQESGHSGYSTYSSGSRSSHRSGKHRSRRHRDRGEEEDIYTEIRRQPRLEAVTEASVEATPVTWRRPQQLEATEDQLREKLASVRADKRRRDGASQTLSSECDINDGAVSDRGQVTSDHVTPDPIITRDPGEELLSLASAASGPLYLNKAELMRYGQARPGRASLVMSPTQQRQEVR